MAAGGGALPEHIVIADARRQGREALDQLEARCRAAGFLEPVVLELRLVAEEVLTNIARHGFEPGEMPVVELLVSLSDAAAVLEFRDQGRAFDPLAQPPSDLDAPLEQRPLGGLGLTLVRALVEEARYVREGPTNVLRLVKRMGGR
ncbi:MAG TPA: ATP-binding protein [Vicinamibacteria bacterium]